MNCVPLPTPKPVGGVALDGGLRPVAALEPQSSSGPSSGLVADSVALAAAMAIGALALTFARRRW